MPIAYIGSQNTATTALGVTSLDAALPNSVQAGDVMIAVVGVMGQQLANGGGDPGLSTPDGWTLIAGGFDAPTVSTSYGFRLNVYWRKYTGTEGPTATWTSSTPGGHLGVGISVYRGADTINGFAVTLNPGTGTTTSYAMNSVTIGDNVRLMSVYGDRTGSTQAFSGGTSYVRNRVETTDVTFELGDSNGAVGAGSYKKTLAYTNATGVGVSILFGLSAASETTTNPTIPPTLTYTSIAPTQAVDARKSASGAGGALSYTVEYVSGAVLTYEQVAPGYFVFQVDDVTDAQYNIVLSETGYPTAIKQVVTIAAIDPDGTAGGGAVTPTTGTSLNETVVRQNGQWS